jgi:galactonate dehydratase
MKITALETIHLAEHPNITFVEVHTDDGLVGLGDTFRAPTTVAAYVHDVAAPLLLGKDPRAIEQHWQTLFTSTVGGGAQMRSTEIRGLSAIDTALWDIAAQAAGLPLYRFLGGPTRASLRVYNTCAGYRYGGPRPAGATANYLDGRREGPYEDLEAFLHRADELAQDLLAEGYTAMKIWPGACAGAAHCAGCGAFCADVVRRPGPHGQSGHAATVSAEHTRADDGQ